MQLQAQISTSMIAHIHDMFDFEYDYNKSASLMRRIVDFADYKISGDKRLTFNINFNHTFCDSYRPIERRKYVYLYTYICMNANTVESDYYDAQETLIILRRCYNCISLLI